MSDWLDNVGIFSPEHFCPTCGQRVEEERTTAGEQIEGLDKE